MTPSLRAAAVVAAFLLLGCSQTPPTTADLPARADRPTARTTSVAREGYAPTSTVARQHLTGRYPAPGSRHYRHAADGQLLPDPACTPGATDPRVTQADIAQTICVRGATTLVRPVVEETDRAKRCLMLAYEQTQPNELDHLIPLELGGSSDVRNLWPEPPPSPNPKDQVESQRHDLVCAAVWHPRSAYLPLAEAQRLIGTGRRRWRRPARDGPLMPPRPVRTVLVCGDHHWSDAEAIGRELRRLAAA